MTAKPPLMVSMSIGITNQSTQNSPIPRRHVRALKTLTEITIDRAMAAVLDLGGGDGGDPRVRDALSLLRQAKEHVSDVVDDRLIGG